jgi:uncharacterized membrane protein
VRADEPGLILEDEIRRRPGLADHALFAAAADDGGGDRCDLAAMSISPKLRRAVLTAHIVASVGLLGECAGILAINVRAATTADPALAASSYELLGMFSVVFGIPLSMASLGTGVALGLGTKWGVLRHRWVTAKLLLILSVIVVGALVIGPAVAEMREGRGGNESVLILASAYDVVALSLATGLSVYKPRRRRVR